MKKVVLNYFGLTSSSEFRGGEEKTPVLPDTISVFIHNFEDPIFIKNDGTQEIWLEVVSVGGDGKHIWFICPPSDFYYIINNGVAETFDSGGEFLEGLANLYPKELEFFLWYPDSINGLWND